MENPDNRFHSRYLKLKCLCNEFDIPTSFRQIDIKNNYMYMCSNILNEIVILFENNLLLIFDVMNHISLLQF